MPEHVQTADSAAPTGPSPVSVLECAVEAEAALEKLATELARAGADPQAVDAVEKMAGVARKIVKAVGKGQEETGDDELPAAPEPQPSRPPTIASASSDLAAESARR